MWTIRVVVISILFFTSEISGCTFSQFSTKPDSRPIFIQKVGSQSLIVPIHGSELEIDESNSVQVYCPGGFGKESFDYDIRKSNTIKLSCNANKIKVHGDEPFELKDEDSLGCIRSPLSIYENRRGHRFCKGTSYFVGMLYENEPITLAEICYDMDKMRVQYQNYMSIERSPVIAQKREYEPLHFYPYEEELVESPSKPFYQNIILMQNQTNKRYLHKGVDYIYEDLIPGNAFEPYYSNPMYSGKAISRIFWWRGLKYGNWRIFEDILKRRSIYVPYEIIMGIMGTNSDCDIRQGPLSEIDLSCTAIPELIWAFLSNEKSGEKFVVIGVNTPYFEILSRRRTVICYDMCDSISWLSPLKRFRNISALGYIYCCRAEDVRNRLEGVDDLFFKKLYRHEIEYGMTTPQYPAVETFDGDEDIDWKNKIDKSAEEKESKENTSEDKNGGTFSWGRK